MATTRPKKTELHTDAEHFGLRVVIFTALIISLVAGFFLIRALLQTATGALPDYAFFVSCAGAVPLALLVVWVLEIQLKRIWPSGRKIVVDADGVQAVMQNETRAQVHWQDGLKTTSWFFEMGSYPRVGRERRVQKNWYCLAAQLQSGDERVIGFTFMPRRQAEQVIESSTAPVDFHRLDPDDVYETSLRSRVSMAPPARPEIPSQVLAGDNGRFWLAEKRRWKEGFELAPDDFVTFLAFIQMNHQEQA